MKKKKNFQKLVLNKQTISKLNGDDLKKIYGGVYTETCGCSTETTKEITKIDTVTCCCWTASCLHH